MAADGTRERKCADTIGTVLVPWAGHFQCHNINIFLEWNIRKRFYRNALGNCYGLKLAKCWSHLKNKFIVIYYNCRHLSFPFPCATLSQKLWTYISRLRPSISFTFGGGITRQSLLQCRLFEPIISFWQKSCSRIANRAINCITAGTIQLNAWSRHVYAVRNLNRFAMKTRQRWVADISARSVAFLWHNHAWNNRFSFIARPLRTDADKRRLIRWPPLQRRKATVWRLSVCTSVPPNVFQRHYGYD